MKLITSIFMLVTFGLLAKRPHYSRSEKREIQRRLEFDRITLMMRPSAPPPSISKHGWGVFLYSQIMICIWEYRNSM